jgi:hypothetical protein
MRTASSRLRGYVEPADAGRSAFDVDAPLGSLAMEPRTSFRSGRGLWICALGVNLREAETILPMFGAPPFAYGRSVQCRPRIWL